jgi:TonB family protein
MKHSRIIFLISAVLLSASSVRAQLPDMQPLADQMAQAISSSKQASVVVVDFFGPDENFTQLGKSLADQFNDDLKKSSTQFAIEERSQMRDWLEMKSLPSDSFRNVDLALWVAGQLKIKSAVTGNISVTGNQVVVEVSLFRVDTRQWVKSFETSTVGSDQAQTLMKALIEDTASRFDPSVPIAGQNGYTHPVCSHCPEIPYTKDALRYRVQGSVVLIAVIGADGTTQKLVVKRALPDGLTENALDTVRQWKFKPSLGPDGRPATVQDTILIPCHFNRQRGKTKR